MVVSCVWQTGTLTSDPFQVERDRLSFLIGGGDDPDNEYVELLVGGKCSGCTGWSSEGCADASVRKSTGENTESMKRVEWDVGEFIGSQVSVRDAVSTTEHLVHRPR